MQVKDNSAKQQDKPFLTQTIFKYVNIVIVLILLYCIPGFLKFRQYCIQKGYYVFSTDSLIWCAVGFVGIFVFKYSYYYLMEPTLESILLPKYEGEERKYKLYSIKKLSMDFIFYSSATIWAYSTFREQYWFPSIVGGKGECTKIYKEYPNWPSTGAAPNMEIYFMVQLGIHLFSIFEMILIKRNTERKYYEYLLHHFIATTLIFFSMMCNEIAVGTIILIMHDASDIMLAFGRGFMETKFSNTFTTVFFFVILTFIWISCRVFIYPMCFMNEIYANIPTSFDEWNMISFEYSYLLFMNVVLLCMHVFWTHFLIKAGFKAAYGKKLINEHQRASQKRKH